jgi:hypothetical protein
MIIASRSSVGTGENTLALRDLSGSGLLPVQVDVPGTATVTFRILGRVNPAMPWVEIRAPASASFLEAISYVPFLRLDITSYSGTGAVRLAIAEG